MSEPRPPHVGSKRAASETASSGNPSVIPPSATKKLKSSVSSPDATTRTVPSTTTTPRSATSSAADRPSSPSSSTAASSSGSKGLRHFSMKVCRKVEHKVQTTYNEVADELVAEVLAAREPSEPRGKYDEKNIRRRVYDALNVLMAMDIIQKEKKNIRWKGLPSNVHHDLDLLQKEGQERQQAVQRKREQLQELVVQHVCFRNLCRHNQELEQQEALVERERRRTPTTSTGTTTTTTTSSTGTTTTTPTPATSTSTSTSTTSTSTSTKKDSKDDRIWLPFIVVNTASNAVIQCEMSPDRTNVMFDFNMPFEINDDNAILKRLGMNKATASYLHSILPDDLVRYCQEHRMLDSILIQGGTEGGTSSSRASIRLPNKNNSDYADDHNMGPPRARSTASAEFAPFHAPRTHVGSK